MIEALLEFIRDQKGEGQDTMKNLSGINRALVEGYIQCLDEIKEFIDDYEQ